MSASTVRQTLLKNIATLGFVGFSPVAPGTLGTLVAFLFILLLKPSLPVLLILTMATVIVGTVASEEAERISGDKDPGFVVIDEVAGYFVSVLFLPLTWELLLFSFILFRIFDILKPPPIKKLQKLKGGSGIMADDIVAGIYANLIVQLWRTLSSA